jgi:hypothetical protein
VGGDGEDMDTSTVEADTGAHGDATNATVPASNDVPTMVMGDVTDAEVVSALGSRTASDAGLSADHAHRTSGEIVQHRDTSDVDAEAAVPPPMKKAKANATVKLSHLEHDDDENE